MDFAEALQHLLSLGHESLSIKLGLHNIVRLLDVSGAPQRCAPAVQVAGTSGKGSTAVMLESVCRAAGIRTGLYTSPHLVAITERVRVDGVPLDEESFAQAVAAVRDAAATLSAREQIYPTFFEQTTAVALSAFREQGVELMILETGLGGRLDATTAAGARTAAITPIAYDHQDYLGTTLAQIAAEKAAIITPASRTAVIAPQTEEARAVIAERLACFQTEARFVSHSHYQIKGADERGRFSFSYQGARERYEDLRLNLPGRHQLINAAVAIELADSLRAENLMVPPAAVRHGLAVASHPGRLEYYDAEPLILLDGAHNVAGAHALRDYLREFVARRVTMIFAAMRDKDLAEITGALFPLAEELVLSAFDNARAADVMVLSSLAAEHRRGAQAPAVAGSPEEALRTARTRTGPGGLICVTGSLYFLGEIKAMLDGESSAATEPSGR